MLHMQDLQSGTAGTVQLTPLQCAPSPTATTWVRCPLLHLPITCRTHVWGWHHAASKKGQGHESDKPERY